jgi:hypothetical protein
MLPDDALQSLVFRDAAPAALLDLGSGGLILAFVSLRLAFHLFHLV